MTKRFTSEFKRSRSWMINDLFGFVVGKTYRNKPYTIHMITHWIYGRTPNEGLDKEFHDLLSQKEPESLTEAAFEGELSEV